MKTSFKKNSPVKLVQKAKPASALTGKPDARLFDAEQFLLPTYKRQPAGTTAKKHRFLALENSFHGRTFGAISVTSTEKYRLPFAPVVPGVEFVRFNDVADLEAKFDDTVCAILIETVQGEGGIYPVSEMFWNRAPALATQHGALLIADEIQCRLGPTAPSFSYQKFPSSPATFLIAKPLAAGLPLG